MGAIDKLLGTGSRSGQSEASLRKKRIVSALAVFLAVCTFGAAGVAPMAPDAANLPVKSIAEELALPSIAQQLAAIDPSPQAFVSEERVRPGDTLATLMDRLGISDDAAAAFIKSDRTARSVLQLKPGKRIQAQIAANGSLQRLSATSVD